MMKLTNLYKLYHLIACVSMSQSKLTPCKRFIEVDLL